MSTAMNFGTKSFQPRPPDKGSFPLDHLGECKSFKEKFMKCLHNNNFENALCRNESKEYLECRMERSRLGLLHSGRLHLPELLGNPPEYPPGQQGEVRPPGRLGGGPSGVHGLPRERRRESQV
ncbi:COX19 isoform 1 [Pan troglodytes]|uniref:Cytochrome c oxidase assembly protein COX19 n=1 Tax=Pan troglodytes TaxID=9598 RepID=A0A2J8KJA1_PANTR|nr:COX19 isoform 1 [Pan troglodytes]